MCVLVSTLVLADGLFVETEQLLVKTKWGFVHGKWSRTVRDRLVANFLGIPYALPPVGELRFRSPQRWNRTWTTIRNATVDGQKCIQYDKETSKVIGSEDCLYLNIFVPQISDEQQKSKKLPVLVVVHGGAFIAGSSDSELFAPDYLLEQDVIVVAMNYRLSALGFFSTANQLSPGNYGIKDVKLALEWIQENIHSFEGDANSVTLMGLSAGGAMTHLLAFSRKTEGLFHRYILHSGSALSTWAVRPQRGYRQTCLKLAKLVGCQVQKGDDVIVSNETTTENPKEDVRRSVYDDNLRPYDTQPYTRKDDEEILRCMRTVDARTLEAMTQYFSVWRKHPLVNFGPTLEDDSEDAILTMHPWKIITDGLFRDIPAIFQVAKDEGLVKTLMLFRNPDVENELIENFEKYLPYFIEYDKVISNTSVFTSAIQNYYFNGNVTLGIAHNITEMTGDGMITWPMFQAVQRQSEIGNASIYFSFFAYMGTFTESFKTGVPIYYGVNHGDDINYLFPILNNQYRKFLLHNTMSDITMINIMTEMWANFIITGIPKATFIPAWPNYRDHHEFMTFGVDKSPETVVQTDFLSDRMEFWQKLMLNELAKSVNNIFVNESPKRIGEIVPIASNAIDRRLSVQFASLLIIYFYV